MNSYLNNLHELLSLLCRHTWSTAAFWLTLAVAIVALFFGAGTVSRVIFGKENGLMKPFLAVAVVIVCALAADAAWLTWGGSSGPVMVVAGVFGAIGGLIGVWFASFILRIAYGPSLGIAVFSVVLFVAAAQGAGYVSRFVMDAASRLTDKTVGEVSR